MSDAPSPRSTQTPKILKLRSPDDEATVKEPEGPVDEHQEEDEPQGAPKLPHDAAAAAARVVVLIVVLTGLLLVLTGLLLVLSTGLLLVLGALPRLGLLLIPGARLLTSPWNCLLSPAGPALNHLPYLRLIGRDGLSALRTTELKRHHDSSRVPVIVVANPLPRPPESPMI